MGSVKNIRRVSISSAFAVVAVMGLLVSVFSGLAGAAELSSASLGLSDPRTSATAVDYTFQASGYTTATSVACQVIEFDTAADGSGGKPAGMDLTSATFTSNGVVAGLSTLTANDGAGTLTFTGTGAAPAASGAIVVGGVVNGSTENDDFYAIFTSYTDGACTGGNEVDSKVVAFVYKNGEPVTLTIQPSLTFTCLPVLSGQAVNGVNTTVASTGTGIDFGTAVNSTTNGISAHDLNVITNATGGYTVSLRQSQAFQNGNGDILDAWTGTNAAPTAFPAAGTEAWGYTTEDATLSGGTATRFTAAGTYAGMPLADEIVMDGAAVGGLGDTTRVGHQVGVDPATPAGEYQTTLVYTVAATY